MKELRKKTHISPGLVADGPGIFSDSGVSTTRFTGSFNDVTAHAALQTAAAPPMSPRMSFMPCLRWVSGRKRNAEQRRVIRWIERTYRTGLDADASGVKGDAFPDKNDGRGVFVRCTFVVAVFMLVSGVDEQKSRRVHLEEFGGFVGTFSNGEEGTLGSLEH